MVKYDPNILQKYAEKLYSSANFIVFIVTTFFALVGFGLGLGLGRDIAPTHVAPENQSMAVWIFGVVGCVLVGIIGFMIGQALTFWYRLKAQLTLCQKQIELNTRAIARASQSPAPFPEIRE
jgi:hypothetical protein